MDPDSHPAIFVIDLPRRQQKLIFFKSFPAYYLVLFEGTFTSFFKEKKGQKKSQNSRNQGFSYYFCLMIESSGSIPLTSGSGSGRPKNMWIQWIRIRNTGDKDKKRRRPSASSPPPASWLRMPCRPRPCPWRPSSGPSAASSFHPRGQTSYLIIPRDGKLKNFTAIAKGVDDFMGSRHLV
jgi:hypothetical protein